MKRTHHLAKYCIIVAGAFLGLLLTRNVVYRRAASENMSSNDGRMRIHEPGKKAASSTDSMAPPLPVQSSQTSTSMSQDLKTKYETVLEKHRKSSKGRPKPKHGHATRFEMEVRYGLREARLLALAYPQETEALALEGLDKAASEDDFNLAVYMLHYLAAEAGRDTSLNALAQRASLPDSKIAPCALGSWGV